MMDKPSIAAVAERLEHLERQCRRSRWIGIAAVLALAVALTAFAARRNTKPSEIRVTNLLVVDEHGQELIRMGSGVPEKHRGLIEFLDKSGEPMMAVGLESPRRPFVWLCGSDRKDELVLEAGAETGGLGITLKNPERDSGLLLTISPGGIAALGFKSSGGNLALHMGVEPDGSALLEIRDREGKKIFGIPKP
jgi:hypothetical protein